jgi:hypothetical protein
MTMYSGIFLKEQVEAFCRENNKDLGEIWQIINRIHTKQFGRNICWEKEQFQRDNNTGDIPMEQWFARVEMVHNAIEILKGLKECIREGWEFE